jgi:hypothetical protein
MAGAPMRTPSRFPRPAEAGPAREPVAYDAVMRIRPGAPVDDREVSPAGRETVTRVLRDVGRLGPYFTVATGPAKAAGPPWRRLDALDPGEVRGLIAAYGRVLGTGEDRVAASILFQGLAARLWSPAVAAAACGVVPDLASLHWRWAPGAPIGLWLAEPSGWTAGDSAGLARRVGRTVVGTHLRPLVETVGRAGRVAEGLLWGNAASALAGVLAVPIPRPELSGPMSEIVRRLLDREPVLSGAGAWGPGNSFTRRSCCLYYRVPPGGAKCGDCVLLHPRR